MARAWRHSSECQLIVRAALCLMVDYLFFVEQITDPAVIDDMVAAVALVPRATAAPPDNPVVAVRALAQAVCRHLRDRMPALGRRLLDGITVDELYALLVRYRAWLRARGLFGPSELHLWLARMERMWPDLARERCAAGAAYQSSSSSGSGA